MRDVCRCRIQSGMPELLLESVEFDAFLSELVGVEVAKSVHMNPLLDPEEQSLVPRSLGSSGSSGAESSQLASPYRETKA